MHHANTGLRMSIELRRQRHCAPKLGTFGFMVAEGWFPLQATKDWFLRSGVHKTTARYCHQFNIGIAQGEKITLNDLEGVVVSSRRL